MKPMNAKFFFNFFLPFPSKSTGCKQRDQPSVVMPADVTEKTCDSAHRIGTIRKNSEVTIKNDTFEDLEPIMNQSV